VLADPSGLCVLAELKAAPATAHVPVIVVSGQRHILSHAVVQGDAVIAKAFGIDALLAEVSRSRRPTVHATTQIGS
jgi:DNA-binding response OmpR family regulator